MENKTCDDEQVGVKKERVTGWMKSVGSWLYQIERQWENQKKEGTQMVEEEDEQLRQELGDEASNC